MAIPYDPLYGKYFARRLARTAQAILLGGMPGLIFGFNERLEPCEGKLSRTVS